MSAARPYRFPPLRLPELRSGVSAADMQSSLAEGFQQGMDAGFAEGRAAGLAEGHADGVARGLAEGRQQGLLLARQEGLARFDSLAQPLDAMLASLRQAQADYHAAIRKEMVELVARVARQVIRCELALQPVQLLALVDETLAAMPPSAEVVQVFLNPEECQRIQELAPERAARWQLLADARLAPGECRVRLGDVEADAGCQQRLDACLEQVSEQLQADSHAG